MLSGPEADPSLVEAPIEQDLAASAVAPALFGGSSRQIRANVVARGGLFAVHLMSGIWLTPYLISHLGLAMYGLVPLANQITSYMLVITVALTGAIGRYLTIELTRGDIAAANRTFNTAFFAILVLSGGLVVVAGGMVYFAPLLLAIPPGSDVQVRILLGGVMLAFIVALLNYTFGASCIARNRLDISSLLEALYPLMRVLTIVVLFNWLGAALWQVGISFTLGSLCMLVGGIIAWRLLTPQLRIARRDFDRTRLRALTGMGGWLSMNSLGSLLFLNADLLVVNLVVGVEAAGSYGAIQQWSLLLRTMAGMLPALVYPNLLAAYAQGAMERLVTISKLTTKLLGLVLALPVGLICGFAQPLLRVWLGPEYVHLWALLVLMTVHLAANHAAGPLLGTQMAYNKVRWMGIATLILGCSNVLLAVVLAGPVHWGMYGVAAAGAFILTLRNTIISPIYTARIMDRPWWTFAGDTLVSGVATVLVAVPAWLLTQRVEMASLPRLCAAGAGIAVVYGVVVYRVALSGADRQTLGRIARPQ